MFKNFIPGRLKQWWLLNKELTACENFDRRQLSRTYGQIIDQIDTTALESFFSDSTPALKKNTVAAPKYYNYKRWLKVNIIRAARYDLHMRKNLDILDLGCGPGWFLRVCSHFGHRPQGLDIALEELVPEDKDVYRKLPELLKCDHRISRHRVQPFTPIDINGSFDVITGFQVCFNNHRKKDVWGIKEWDYFIKDLKHRLNKNGKIILELNADKLNYPDGPYYDKKLQDLFSKHGRIDEYRLLME